MKEPARYRCVWERKSLGHSYGTSRKYGLSYFSFHSSSRADSSAFLTTQYRICHDGSHAGPAKPVGRDRMREKERRKREIEWPEEIGWPEKGNRGTVRIEEPLVLLDSSTRFCPFDNGRWEETRLSAFKLCFWQWLKR